MNDQDILETNNNPEVILWTNQAEDNSFMSFIPDSKDTNQDSHFNEFQWIRNIPTGTDHDYSMVADDGVARVPNTNGFTPSDVNLPFVPAGDVSSDPNQIASPTYITNSELDQFLKQLNDSFPSQQNPRPRIKFMPPVNSTGNQRTDAMIAAMMLNLITTEPEEIVKIICSQASHVLDSYDVLHAMTPVQTFAPLIPAPSSVSSLTEDDLINYHVGLMAVINHNFMRMTGLDDIAGHIAAAFSGVKSKVKNFLLAHLPIHPSVNMEVLRQWYEKWSTYNELLDVLDPVIKPLLKMGTDLLLKKYKIKGVDKVVYYLYTMARNSIQSSNKKIKKVDDRLYFLFAPSLIIGRLMVKRDDRYKFLKAMFINPDTFYPMGDIDTDSYYGFGDLPISRYFKEVPEIGGFFTSLALGAAKFLLPKLAPKLASGIKNLASKFSPKLLSLFKKFKIAPQKLDLMPHPIDRSDPSTPLSDVKRYDITSNDISKVIEKLKLNPELLQQMINELKNDS